MLEKAKAKAARAELTGQTGFYSRRCRGFAFPNEYFDCIGISFAFRNLTYKNPNTPRYLSEIVRVLKKGGRFVIVESSQPPNKLLRGLDHLYLRTFVRWMGTSLSKNKELPMYYLTASASKFYTAEELSELLVKAGFNDCNHQTPDVRRDCNSCGNQINSKLPLCRSRPDRESI
jgi:demethylmenaquinone methyltransferase/2-methoxy-6-polyprenyl-1,4-benzoquinol methylase